MNEFHIDTRPKARRKNACPECGHIISVHAKACPHCGRPKMPIAMGLQDFGKNAMGVGCGLIMLLACVLVLVALTR
jgi:hypothetical protein